MTNRRLTARQLTAALAKIDAQLDLMRAAEKGFNVFLTDDGAQVPDAIYAAWNDTHCAIDTLEFYRGQVEANPRPIPPGQAVTYALVAANID